MAGPEPEGEWTAFAAIAGDCLALVGGISAKCPSRFDPSNGGVAVPPEGLTDELACACPVSPTPNSWLALVHAHYWLCGFRQSTASLEDYGWAGCPTGVLSL